MTRKDFELIAATLKEQRWHKLSEEQVTLLDNVALDFATRLHATNAAFDTARFLKACGVET